ncbi:MAG: PEP-CTERM sorting domain-containing protein [Pseudomonadota bacterium]
MSRPSVSARYSPRPRALALAMAAMLTGGQATWVGAADKLWSCGSGLWSANCWELESGQATSTPGAMDQVWLSNGTLHDRVVTFDSASALNLDLLILRATSFGSMTLKLDSNRTFNGGDEIIGYDGIGFASFVQTGGINNAASVLLGYDFNSQGSYVLTGGILNGGSYVAIGVDGWGSFLHSGGSHFSGELRVGSHGTGSYTLSGNGLLQTDETYVAKFTGASGQFTQNGGTHVTDGLVIGQGGMYQLSDGEVNAGNLIIGRTNGNTGYGGGFNQAGGSMTVSVISYLNEGGVFNLSAGQLGTSKLDVKGGTFNQLAGIHDNSDTLKVRWGSYQLSGTGKLNAKSIEIGDIAISNDSAAFNQTGGELNLTGTLSLGKGNPDAIATYLLQDGTMQSGGVVIGDLSRGSFVQLAGLHGTSSLILGNAGGGDGEYQLSGGQLNATQTVVGKAGQGRFTQSGGLFQTNTLELGETTGSTGAFTLTGGQLVTGALTYGQGSGTFTQMGGLHQVTSQLGIGGAQDGSYLLAGGVLDLGSLSGTVHTTGTLNLAGGSFVGSGLNQNGLLWVTEDSTLTTKARLGARSLTRIDANLTLDGAMTISHNLAHDASVIGAGLFTLGANSQVSGQGKIAVNLVNHGLIQAKAGNLTLAGDSLANHGTLRNGVGANLFVTSGSVNNQGNLEVNAAGAMVFDTDIGVASGRRVDLKGGTLAAPSVTVFEGGRMAGFGAVTGNVINAGEVEFFGSTNVAGDFVNGKGATLIVRNNQTLITGLLTNDGTIRTIKGSVVYEGGLINNGVYISDPSDNHFASLTVGTSGYLVGELGDRYILGGDFINHSLQHSLWDTDAATLVFAGPGEKAFHLAGADLGSVFTGYADNFAWGVFELAGGATLALQDGNDTSGAALYVGQVVGVDIQGDQIGNIIGHGYNIYYDAGLAENAYLGGQTYLLQEGGVLAAMAPVPEAQTWTMLLAGLGLVGLQLRRRNHKDNRLHG